MPIRVLKRLGQLRLVQAIPALVLAVGVSQGSPAWSHEPPSGTIEGPSARTGDVIVGARPATDGYQLFVARRSEQWAWRPLATLQPGADAEEPWIGYQCLTGDSRFVVAVVAPRGFVNVPALRDRGGSAYSVQLATGRVRPLLSGLSLKHHTPGCGRGSTVALTRNLGRDQAVTEAISVDAATGNIASRERVRSQVTHVVPTTRGLTGLAGGQIVRLRAGKAAHVARLKTPAISLRAAASGLDVLTADPGSRVTVWRVDRRGPRRVAIGELGKTRLFAGRGGRNVVVGGRPAASSSGLAFAEAPVGQALAASAAGGAVLSAPVRPPARARARAAAGHHGSDPGAVGVPAVDDILTRGADGRMLRDGMPDSGAPATTRVPRRLRSPRSPTARVAANTTTPKCAVPRNDLRRQAPQPNARQVNWAIQQATRNLLKGAVLTRPANFASMGLASYQPSLDFARGALRNGGTKPVPPSVIQAVFAQESAWLHASRRALPGLSASPSISDYYGSAGTLDTIDYDLADCGYGVSQVTDYMTASNPYLSANGKAKVAVDYAENVAVGITFLVNKWNQLYDAGLILNNGDPQYLENWYFATWAYNSGFYPNTGSGPWGLGWTNNPQNADYPADRQGFLRGSYADAARPGDWPYQERVLGWMETPLLDYRGNPSYAKPRNDQGVEVGVTLPHRSLFCTAANDPAANDCDPNYVTGDGKDYCTRADRKCWWHSPVQFANCATSCAHSVFTIDVAATEPPADNNYPPACSSTLPSGSVIVDNQPSNLNVEGCGSSNWTSQGTFTVSYGRNAANVELGQIDWHQLGTGFGGHIWFTKNQRAQDTAHINTGTWTPPSLNGIYSVHAHVPVNGASTSFARYRIHRGDGTVSERIIDQHLHVNRWVTLGSFTLQPGAKVVLDNVTPEADERQNVAFDAVAFTPVQGTRVRRTIDAVTTFDTNQDLDTILGDLTPGIQPTIFEDMESIYEWAEDLTSGPAAMPQCPSGSRTSSCLPAATKQAFAQWRSRVLAAGSAPQSPEASDTQAKWLAFASPDPPATLTDEFLQNPSNYKVRSRLAVEYLQSNGLVDPASVAVTFEAKSGDTHLPGFALDIMRSIRDDYGIALPNLSYQAVDLHEYTHATTSANPVLDGRAPGRAFHPWVTDATLVGNCVRVQAVSGGTIGLKPMIHAPGIPQAAAAWRQRVHAVVDAGAAPASLARAADDIYDLFFSPGDISEGDLESPFWFAPPIWIQHNAEVCDEGTVRPIADQQLVDSGYMPDLYIFVDRQRVDVAGLPTTGPAQLGQFKPFSAPGGGFPHPGGDPWDPCYIVHPSDPSFLSRRDGSPWDLDFSTSEDQSPDAVRLCTEPKDVRHRE